MIKDSVPEKLNIIYSPEFAIDLPPGHKFPIRKYKMIPERLLAEGIISKENLHAPKPADPKIVELTHSREYVDRVQKLILSPPEIRKIGFPLTEDFVRREFMISQGTIDGALSAIKTGISFNTAGGTHHAFSDLGSGYCIFNDVAVAANYLLYKSLKKRILIIDLDVHQGNGTAAIFKNEERVFTFSMHSIKDWPVKKEKSDIDVELDIGTEDEEYLSKLSKYLPEIIEHFAPDFVFYISGADVVESDRWGSLKLTPTGVLLRDQFVFKICKNTNVPIMVTMGGGYSKEIDLIVKIHCNTFKIGISEVLGQK